MNLSFLKSKKTNSDTNISYKKERTDSHHLWMVMISTFIIALTIETAFFSWYFLQTTKKLDNATIPELKTNAKKISSIKKIIENIESSISARLGNDGVSSQN